MSKETLLEWTSGEGQVRRRDGAAIGTRHYDIEVWQHGGADGASGSGPASPPLPTTLKVSIDFSDVERRELAGAGTALVLVTEDGRQIEFSVRAPDGAIIPQQGGLNRPQPSRTLAAVTALALIAVLYLSQRFGLLSWLMNMRFGLPIVMATIALGVIVFGMSVSARRRHPGYFMFGVVVLAIGIMSLYALPIGVLLIVKRAGGPDELGGILAFVSMAFGGMLFIGGGWVAIKEAW